MKNDNGSFERNILLKSKGKGKCSSQMEIYKCEGRNLLIRENKTDIRECTTCFYIDGKRWFLVEDKISVEALQIAISIKYLFA